MTLTIIINDNDIAHDNKNANNDNWDSKYDKNTHEIRQRVFSFKNQIHR